MTGLTVAAVVCLAAAAASALVDWWAVARLATRARVEYAAKPAVLVALLLAAATLRTPLPAERGWFLAALACCLAGDVLLMLPGETTPAFAGGLGAFLAGHVLFLVGLAGAGARAGTALAVAGGLLVIAVHPASRVLRGVVGHLGKAMVGPVVVYMAALLAMAAAAWSAGLAAGTPALAGASLIAGGSLFVVSDTLLSWDRFVQRLPRGDVLVHVTYHLAVGGLVLSLAGR